MVLKASVNFIWLRHVQLKKTSIKLSVTISFASAVFSIYGADADRQYKGPL